MEKKYLIVALTNGEGYSDPTIEVLSNKKEAQARFEELCGHIELDPEIIRINTDDDKRLYQEIDGNDYGVHLIELQYFTNYVLKIKTNYSDCVSVTPYTSSTLRQHMLSNRSDYDWNNKSLTETPEDFDGNFHQYDGFCKKHDSHIYLETV